MLELPDASVWGILFHFLTIYLFLLEISTLSAYYRFFFPFVPADSTVVALFQSTA